MTSERKNGTLVLEDDPFRREEETPQQHGEDHMATETPAAMTDTEAKAAQAQLLDASVEETIRKQQHTLMSEEVKFAHYQRIAKLFAASGYFEDLKVPVGQAIARAVVKIQLGEAVGLAPMEAMQSVYMVNGRPTVDAQVRAARMKRCGYDWDILEHTDKCCRLAIKFRGQYLTREDGSKAIVEFTMDDAAKAGLSGKDVWKKYPRNMLFARTITNAQRWYAPEALNGMTMLDPSEVVEIAPAEPSRPLFKTPEAAA